MAVGANSWIWWRPALLALAMAGAVHAQQPTEPPLEAPPPGEVREPTEEERRVPVELLSAPAGILRAVADRDLPVLWSETAPEGRLRWRVWARRHVEAADWIRAHRATTDWIRRYPGHAAWALGNPDQAVYVRNHLHLQRFIASYPELSEEARRFREAHPEAGGWARLEGGEAAAPGPGDVPSASGQVVVEQLPAIPGTGMPATGPVIVDERSFEPEPTYVEPGGPVIVSTPPPVVIVEERPVLLVDPLPAYWPAWPVGPALGFGFGFGYSSIHHHSYGHSYGPRYRRPVSRHRHPAPAPRAGNRGPGGRKGRGPTRGLRAGQATRQRRPWPRLGGSSGTSRSRGSGIQPSRARSSRVRRTGTRGSGGWLGNLLSRGRSQRSGASSASSRSRSSSPSKSKSKPKSRSKSRSSSRPKSRSSWTRSTSRTRGGSSGRTRSFGGGGGRSFGGLRGGFGRGRGRR